MSILLSIGCDYLERLLIDTLGIGLGIYVTVVIYDTFWVRKKIKIYFIIVGIIAIASISVIMTLFLHNTRIMILPSIAGIYALSCFYNTTNTYRIFISLAVAAAKSISEVLIAAGLVNLFSISYEQIQDTASMYIFGVLTSNLIALFIVYIIRAFAKKSSKQDVNTQFNLLMASMPIQSIILCYIVFDYSVKTGTQNSSPLGIAAVFLSLLLIFITMFILDKQKKALANQKENDLVQMRQKMQIEHYRNLYQEQHAIKSIRHDINNNMIAISGMLKAGQIQKATDRIDEIHERVMSKAHTVDTGLPPIDAILSEKIAKGKEIGIDIAYTILVDNELSIDQFDIAVIVANALDNAIEGTLRSVNVDKKITLNISRIAEYISILIENNATGPVFEGFKTSKPDNMNHGFGMAQMRAIAQKYNGSFQPNYNSDAKRFSLKIMLKNQQAN